jgi:2-oxoglutarate dehydrogenase E2 component (dihydrolipoamide succinyltransferase)
MLCLEDPTILAAWSEIGMHATKDRPVVVDGQIVIRPIMIVALTYDHRLLDGREAVTFLGK